MSRSNCAKLIRRFTIIRPIEDEVSICWVTDTMLAPCREKIPSNSVKSRSEREMRSSLYTTTTSIFPSFTSFSNSCSPGRFMFPPE